MSQNLITGERLKDLFSNDTWRDHFEALSDTLGFTLSVYSDAGDPVYVPESAYPLCKAFHSQSSDLKSLCDSSCRPFLMNTLAMGKPNVFKCHAKIMSFAFPVEYLNEKAVVLGQGSFASYEDFRDCMDMVSAYGIEMITIKTPLSFTSSKQAWKACRFVADTVSRHLNNMQETVTLRRKFESLKSVFSLWGSAAVADPERRYQDMLYNLSTLLDIDHITVLTLDRQRGRYASLYGLARGGVAREFSISLEDTIVLELQGGKPFVHTAAAPAESGSEVLSDNGTSFCFPIMINGTMGGILHVADKMLK